jgi:hypothetical protein
MRMTRVRRMCADCLENVVNPLTSAKSVLSAFYFVTITAIVLLFAAPVAAQEENRAGLVIVHGDGSMVTQCIAFAEEAISGAELLARSKLDLSMEASGMGATICRIDGEGCDFPAETCFCQCQGSPCIYWSYWRLTEGEWRYSNIGAGNAVVRDGDVDGWRWGQGTVDKAESPPAVAFEDICVEPIRAAAPASTPTRAVDEERPTAESSPQPASSQTAATGSANQPVSPDATPTPLTALGILLGALVVLPIAALLLVWLRSGGKERGR